MVSKAAQQFIDDCGNNNTVIDVAKTMLIESGTITIDDSITWTIIGEAGLYDGVTVRVTINTMTYYYSNGSIANAFCNGFVV